ncbi:hypothetical protein BGZ83_006884 [Gryganskiella cystojenkinii]|nr:hypothetical protein BGZ83_006884 [Gryganskiella cystojenkinii]
MVLQQFLMSTQWIDEALDRSWDRAFDSDRSLIQELQYEFHCLGFKDAQDRAMPYSSEGVMPQPCAQVMRTMFGKRLQHLGLILLSIRLLQLAGVLLLTVLIKYLAALDQEQREKQEQEEQQQQAEQELARIEAKLGQSQQMEAKLKKDQERDRLLEAEDNEVVTVCVQA